MLEMRLVVDANILFAALLRKGVTSALLIREDLELFAPALFWEEFTKYEMMILARTHRDREEFAQIVEIFRERIAIVAGDPEEVERMVPLSPDPGDASYLVLALRLGIPLWTADKQLRNQVLVEIYSTTEVLRRISR